MGIIVKNQSLSTIEIRYRGENPEEGMKSMIFQPGRNILQPADWDKVRDHSGFVKYVNKDMFTINTEGEIAQKPAAKVDWTYVENLAGNEDGKDIMKEYALGFSIVLNKKMNFENMLGDFKEKYGE